MKKTLAKTVTAGNLSETGMELRLEHPRAPHTMPHKGGGFLRLSRYVVDTAVVPVAGFHHGHGHGHGHYHHSQQLVAGGGRLEVEVIHYSGYADDDGLTLLIDERGVGSTTPMCWAAGSVVSQDADGEDWHELYDLIMTGAEERQALYELLSSGPDQSGSINWESIPVCTLNGENENG